MSEVQTLAEVAFDAMHEGIDELIYRGVHGYTRVTVPYLRERQEHDGSVTRTAVVQCQAQEVTRTYELQIVMKEVTDEYAS